MPLIEFQQVHKNYPLGTTIVPALQGVSFTVQKGDFFTISGPSGSGKSTILNMIGCIDTPSQGEVVIEGVQTSSLNASWSAGDKQEWVSYLLDKVGLKDYAQRRPAELSGGQRQRVAIARALSTKPTIVLADEPTANLDSKTGDQIIHLMREMNQQLSTTFVFSTHDPQVLEVADHVVKIRDGMVEEDYRTAGIDSSVTDAGVWGYLCY